MRAGKASRPEDGHQEHRPHGEGQPHHGQALGAHVDDRGHEVEAAHGEGRDEEAPSRRSRASAPCPSRGSRCLQRGERRVGGPAAGGRARAHEEGGRITTQPQKEGPEAEAVQEREGHVARADLERDEQVAEAAHGRGGHHEEHHDGAVHREQHGVELGVHDPAARSPWARCFWSIEKSFSGQASWMRISMARRPAIRAMSIAVT